MDKMNFTKVNNRLEKIETLLKEQITLNKEILNFKDACLFLGITNSHLYKLTSTSQIPHSKPGGKKIFFKRSELEAWAMSNQIGTAADIEKAANDYLLKNPLFNN